MNRKLLFFDIDGTLLCGGVRGFIPKSTLQALHMAQKQGHLLFINTGRAFCYLPEQVMEFPFDGYVCGCGTEVFLHGKEIFHHVLPYEIRTGLKDIFKQTGIQGIFEGRKALYFNPGDDMFPPIAWIYQSSLQNGDYEVHTFDDPEPDFDKFIIFKDRNSNFPLFKDLVSDYFEIILTEDDSDYQFGEVIPRQCSKATGIDQVTQYLGLSPDDCYVFGDSANDLPMLMHVKNSIAMGNSLPEILGKTAYVTTPIHRDGIMLAMKHFGLI